MKKIIYSIMALAAAVIFVVGCSKEKLPTENTVTGKVTLNASLSGSLTRTAVDGSVNTKINWSENDSISVWGGENNKFTLSSGKGTANGSFSGSVTSGTAQYAMYPYIDTAKINEGVITTNVPTVQTVSAGSFDPKASIMVGTISGTTITFIHALAYLKITAPSDVTDLAEITIESNGGVQLTGDAKFTASTGAFTATGTANKFVTVKPADGTFTAGDIYYAAVIPGAYTGGLTVRYLYKTDAAHITEKTKSNTSDLELSAGTAKLLGAATSFDNTYDAVQLWENGPYWATTNIGANAETDYGYYFAWGYTDACIRNSDNNGWVLASDGKTVKQFNATYYPHKSDFIDAAKVYWGTDWSTPTDADFSNLINSEYTEVENVTEGIKGRRIKGKTGTAYEGCSIFLPAAGSGSAGNLSYAGTHCCYWSSVEDTEDYAWYLTTFPSLKVNKYGKHYGYPVRPVRSSL